MTAKIASVNLSVLLLCLAVLAGCRKTESKTVEDAAELEKVKAEFANLKSVLAQTESERDQLKERMAAMFTAVDNAKSALTNAIQLQEQLQNQVAELTKRRDELVLELQQTRTTIAELTNRLQEKTAETHQLEQWNQEWQLTVQQLQSQIEQAGQQVIEEHIEEPNMLLEEEVADDNNV